MIRASAFRTAGRSAALASAIVLSWAASARAQRITGELSGTVVDEPGRAVPGADVALTHEASRATRRTVTNAGPASSPSPPSPRAPTRDRRRCRASDPRGDRHRALRLVTAGRCARSRWRWRSMAETRVGDRRRGAHAAQLGREERDPDRRADPDDARGRHERGRGPAGAAWHDAAHRRNDTNRPELHRARSTASTATASTREAESTTRARSATTSANGARIRGPRHHRRRRLRRRPRLQLRDLGQPQHRDRAGVQGAPVELRGRAREGPGRACSFVSKQGGRDFHGSVFG